MFPLSHKGRGDFRADFLTSMQDSDSPLPSWERDADTCKEFCSGAGEGSSAYVGAYARKRANQMPCRRATTNFNPRSAQKMPYAI